jgi:hypothetical protein
LPTLPPNSHNALHHLLVAFTHHRRCCLMLRLLSRCLSASVPSLPPLPSINAASNVTSWALRTIHRTLVATETAVSNFDQTLTYATNREFARNYSSMADTNYVEHQVCHAIARITSVDAVGCRCCTLISGSIQWQWLSLC